MWYGCFTADLGVGVDFLTPGLSMHWLCPNSAGVKILLGTFPFDQVALIQCCDLVSKSRSLEPIGRRELQRALTSLGAHRAHEWKSHIVNVSLQY